MAHLFSAIGAEYLLLAQLLYGTGMRITEAIGLRVKDVDFEHRAVIVHEGAKDSVVMLLEVLVLVPVPALRQQLARARLLRAADRECGCACVYMPDALDRKYPRAGAAWTWFWLFPQATLSVDTRPGVLRRHHVVDPTFQRAFKRAGIKHPATPHTLCHSFPTIS